MQRRIFLGGIFMSMISSTSKADSIKNRLSVTGLKNVKAASFAFNPENYDICDFTHSVKVNRSDKVVVVHLYQTPLDLALPYEHLLKDLSRNKTQKLVVYGSDKKELYSMNFDGVHDYVFEVDIDIESKTTLDKVVFEYTKETIKVPYSKCPIL